MKKPALLALIVLIAASLACNAVTGSGSNPGSPASSEASKVLFQDDFSSTSSGWDSYSGDDGVTDYANNATAAAAAAAALTPDIIRAFRTMSPRWSSRFMGTG